MSARAFAAFMAVLAVVGLLAYGLITKGVDTVAVGEPLPVTELDEVDGSGTGSIRDYRGDWVLVNVWASWCDPCRAEAPLLERFYRAHRAEDFTVVGVDTLDNSADAEAFIREFGLTYPQLREDGDSYSKGELGTRGVPESFLIDPGGEVVLHRPGPVDEEYLDALVKPYITGDFKP